MRNLTIGTRGSALAVTQAEWLKTVLGSRGMETRIQTIRTHGDNVTEKSFAEMNVQGVFTKEIEEALLAKTIDIGVHCLKDLPTRDVPGLRVAAICERADPRECLVIAAHAYDAHAQGLPLKSGISVGTSSIRREWFIQYIRPDLHVRGLRGNVGTRVKHVVDGKYDAIVLAMAGLTRLQWEAPPGIILVPLSVERMIPSPGQGALALQVRDNDADAIATTEALNHPETARAVHIERSLVRMFDGGCHLPLAAFSESIPGGMRVRAFYGQEMGRLTFCDVQGDDDNALIDDVFRSLRA